jgi:hypothetical protein
MGVKVLWNASTNVIAAELPADYSDILDYSDISGLPNVAASSGKTGDIKFTLSGTVLPTLIQSFLSASKVIKGSLALCLTWTGRTNLVS